MMKIKKAYLISALTLLPALTLEASQEERLDHLISLSLEDLVSLETTIATASKHTAIKAPAVVTLITAEDIKATGATNVVEVLEGVPGVHVRTSHFANRPFIQIRGAKASQTLVMVNGATMKDLIWGSGIFWKGLPVSIIERVEIIRGPGSALFGADAGAGVINIITKTAGKIEDTQVGARVGSFNTKAAWVQHGGSVNGFDIGITADISDTGSYNPFIESDGQTRSDLLSGSNVSYAPGDAQYGYRNEDLRFSVAKDHWRVHADYSRHSNLQIGLTGAGVLDPVTEGSDSRYNIDWFYNNGDFSESWDFDAELRYQDLDYTSGTGFQERPPGYIDSNGDLYPDGQLNHLESAERRIIFESSGLYNGLEGHAIRIGAGYTKQDLYLVSQQVNSGTGTDGQPITPGSALVDVSDTPYAFAPEGSREITHVFLQDIWNFASDWELTAGARYDDYSDFGHTVNPRVALVWQSTSNLTTKLLYGQAFRAPSYQELFAETSRSLPNADLNPENSETIDLSFSYVVKSSLQFGMNLYLFKQTDIIALVDTGLSKKQYQNTGEHDIKGIEFETRWQASNDVGLYFNFTQRNQNEHDGFRVVQEADQEAYIRSDWGFLPKWNWNIQANWIGERERPATDTRPPVASAMIADTTLRYAASARWELAASVRNLFDEDAREYTGASINDDLPSPERNFYLEVKHTF